MRPRAERVTEQPARVAGILTVYAHPDDESFGPAALLAKYARQGARLSGLFATRGQHGESHLQPPPSPAELGRLREMDLREAAALIGYTALEVLEYEDGRLAAVPADELQACVFQAIEHYRPTVVLTFGPGGITRHPDHIAIHRAATAAFHVARQAGLGVRELYYDALDPERARERGLADLADGQPNTFIDVAETFAVKLEALRRHARHIADAREMVERLEASPQCLALLHRAWPPVPAGQRLTALLQS